MRVNALFLGLVTVWGSGCCSAGTASFDLVSNPPGAAVAVDGKRVGTTPMTLPLVVDRPACHLAGTTYAITLTPPEGAGPQFRAQTRRLTPSLAGGRLLFDLAVPSSP